MNAISSPSRFDEILEAAKRKPSVPTPDRFEAVLAKYRRQRFDLCANLDGYEIRDRGEVIATFHGPQLGLASRLLRLLREDAERARPV